MKSVDLRQIYLKFENNHHVPGSNGDALAARAAAGDAHVALGRVLAEIDELGALAARVVEDDALVAAGREDVRLGPCQGVGGHRVSEYAARGLGGSVLGHVVADDAAVGVARQEARAACAAKRGFEIIDMYCSRVLDLTFGGE